MSILEDLLDAIKENTAALKSGGAEPAKETPKAERGSRSRDKEASDDKKERGSRDRGSDSKAPSEADFKDTTSKFLDLPESPENDAEYDRRLEKVIDPILEKAKAKQLVDLPKEYWGQMLDDIAAYLKDNEKGETRTRRGR